MQHTQHRQVFTRWQGFEMKITIPLTPISKKNSQRIFRNRKTGAPFITQSEAYKAYERAALYYIRRPQKPIDTPVNVKMVFYLPDKRRGDLVNYQEAALDILVRAGVLADDNYKIVQSMDGSRVLVDKARPRTEIEITEAEA